MARQIIRETIEIILPKCEGTVKNNYQRYELLSVSFIVADQQKITLTDIEAEKTFLGVPVDIYGEVKGIPFILYFTHPGREVPHELRAPSLSKYGVVSISLTKIHSYFRGSKKQKKSYYEILNDFLVKDIISKEWVFHPRYKRHELKAIEKLEHKAASPSKHRNNIVELNRLENVSSLNRVEPLIIQENKKNLRRLAKYECVMCHTTWQDWDPGASTCPKCKTHLYRSLVEYVDDET